MAIEDPTFGCGTFLPGEGPGNYSDFNGGGTIDGGGGGNGGGIDPGDPIDPTDGGPPWEGPPWDQGFPTWPDDIIIITDDPTGSWPDRNYYPASWDDNFNIVNAGVKDALGTTPTYGGQPYTITYDDFGVLTFPSLPIDLATFASPLTLRVFMEWPSTIPGDPTVWTHVFEKEVTVDDKGGSDGGGWTGEKVEGGTPIGGEGFEQSDRSGSLVTFDPANVGTGPTVVIGEGGDWNPIIDPGQEGVTLFYNNPNPTWTLSDALLLDPSEWNSNTDSVSYIELLTSEGNIPTFEGGIGYGWDQTGLTGVSYIEDSRIQFDSINGEFDEGDEPYEIFITVSRQNIVETINVKHRFSIRFQEAPQGLTQGPGLPNKLINTKSAVISNAKTTGVIDLNSPELVRNILKKKPTGIQDSDVAFLINPPAAKMIRNQTGHTDIFADRIDSNISYILKNRRNSGDWDSTRAAGVTPQSVYASLRPNVRKLLEQVRNYDGTHLTTNQIYHMIGTRILDGTVSTITLKYIKNLVEASKKRVPTTIIRSSNNTVNEVAAASLIDKNKFTLDPSKAKGRMQHILPNWKTLATDIDQYLPIKIAGVDQKFFVKDDNTFVEGRDLKIQDGNYVDIVVGGVTQRLFTKSEIDHAFILPEATKQKALSLLGANTGRTLEVSGPSGVEFDYSVTAPRQNFYVLSAVLSSINTVPSPIGSFLLKNSTIQYELLDTSTTDGLRDVNNFIKYKANNRVFMLDDEDLILDYLTSTGKLTMEQTDILFDSPKTNKSTPVLTRQIPWYIIVYPTNRSEYNIFNDKSHILSIASDGTTTRRLKCSTTIVPEFSKSQTNKFARIQTDGKDALNVLGERDTQARITAINPNDTVFKTGYKKNNTLVESSTFTGTRKKTGYRLVKEIISELDTNYLLSLNGVGKLLTEFDVFSRLYLNQFIRLAKLENFIEIRDAIRRGQISNVKVIPPIRHSSSDISYRNTLLVRRKKDVPEDTFKSIKGTRNRQTIVPPTVVAGATAAPVPSPVTPT